MGNHPAEPERLDLRSHDVAEERRQELLRLFPEVRTQGGRIDFDRLKLALGETVDVGKERYAMTWPGKADCFRAIQTPSIGTLLPAREESVNFDTTENLIIEGDNLEVLKLLQKSYLGKVKMIYIDPPYNTGNDFIYPDNYTQSLQTYFELTGQTDVDGKRLGTNSDTEGRFHSKWLNMMYPRLYLARNLLREDGVMFISIDDAEQDNLKKICVELFGEENIAATFVRRRRMATGLRDTPLSPDHEYILCISRNIDALRLFGFESREEDFPLRDDKGSYRSTDLTVGMTREMRPGQFYAVIHPTTGQAYWPPVERVWRFEPATMKKHVLHGNVIWPDDNPTGRMTRPRFKTRFAIEGEARTNPISTWIDSRSRAGTGVDEGVTELAAGLNQEATKEVRELLGEQVLEYPKPVSLIKTFVSIATRPDDLVLDFFAGSGTTGQAVLEMNAEDSGNRRFILVQLPQPTDRTDYATIAEIAKARVRRVIGRMNERASRELPLEGRPEDGGFRVFKLAESNFAAWNGIVSSDASALAQQIEMHVHHARTDRGVDDRLFEILLKSGRSLGARVEQLRIAEKVVFSADQGAFLICLERNLTLDLIRAVADRKPERVVCLDEGFAGNDQLKANAAQIFKTKGVTSFKTV